MHRPKILVFEWLCGGGLHLDGIDPGNAAGMRDQGRQMLSALCDDFLAANCDPIVPLDSRLNCGISGQRVPVDDAEAAGAVLENLAPQADGILVIAPETGSRLLGCLKRLAKHSCRLLNPNLDFTRLASDKNELQSFLARQGIPVPDGDRLSDWIADDEHRLKLPLVLKPSDGCGGEGLRLIESAEELQQISSDSAGDWRIEKIAEGTAVSVSVILSSNSETLFLPPLRQIFDNSPIGKFVRCENDLPTDIAARATKLARQAVSVLPATSGYFGIDMVIGSADVVIEVNPRMTMSYCQLRSMVSFNLAARMSQISEK